MPSPMIHLLVAYEINPEAPDSFWVGNLVPDYTNDRQLKDEIHFRNAPNRMEALKQLRKNMNNNNPFEAGWLLHLSSIPSELPIAQCEAEWYRDRLYRRHSESKIDAVSLEYNEEL